LLLIAIGSAAALWGVWAAYSLPRPRAWAGVIAAPLGVALALGGALLWFVPGFFSR
jgi:hypothetical protein